MSGQTIREVSLLPVPDADDDWIEIKFGPQDPAISKLKINKRE
jgi:hypothetical protein